MPCSVELAVGSSMPGGKEKGVRTRFLTRTPRLGDDAAEKGRGELRLAVWSTTSRIGPSTLGLQGAPPRAETVPDTFSVCIGIHWVAMGVTQSHFYFFDANEGLFRYDQQFEFRSDVNSGDNFGYYESHDWMTNPGKVCNCYEIVSN